MTSAGGRGVARIVTYGVLIAVGALFVLPFLWLILASLQPGAGLSASLGDSFSLGNFQAVLTWETVFSPMLNSLILAGGSAALTSVIAALAAYPLSRYAMRFRRPFLYVIIFSTGLPITAIMVPVYSLFAHFELTDSVPATMAFMTATSLPYAIWLMKNFMDGVPVSLEEAAWTDGAGAMQTLTRVVLPLMAPGVAVVFMFTFAAQWGDFFIPFILLITPEKLPASVTIYSFFNAYGQAAYGQLAAFSILYTTPIVALYLIMSRFLGGSFNLAGGVKG